MKTKYIKLFEDHISNLARLAQLGLTDWPQVLIDYLDGLVVGGDLYLQGTGIKTLPASARVGGKIFYTHKII